MSAPFAGHAAGVRSRDELPNMKSSGSFANKVSNKRRTSGRFSEISIDNILSEMSDVPSGRREERLSSSSADRHYASDKPRSLNYSKMINPLPARTSKTSQKLVLIPEEADGRESSANAFSRKRSTTSMKGYGESARHTKKDEKLARITAYNVAEGFNLKLMSKFLKCTHEVSPRMYDECLYVAYTLPLLLGKDGFRVKSNISKKL